MVRILVTGDRNWRNATRIAAVFDMIFGERWDFYGPEESSETLIEGEAMGADIISAVVWELKFPGWPIERYPADWNTHGRAAGPIRNTQMRKSGVDCVIGFHNDIENSKGTRDMLRQCAKNGIPGRLFTEEGEVDEWQSLVSS